MRRLAGWFGGAALLLSLSVGARAQAQEDGTEAGTGFRGGQMVRGVVTAAAGDRIAVKTDAGEAYQVTVTANTRMMKDRQPIRVAEIKVGDWVGAMGVLDAPQKTVHAMMVMVMDAEQARKAREGLGKVYIVGKVTAIDELKLTVLRPDGVSQVIAVDEGTSFRKGGRGMQSMMSGVGPVPEGPAGGGPGGAATGAQAGGESITLADIKVGDSVGGRGGMKGATFVPTELAVMDPASRARRRRPQGAGGTAAPGTNPTAASGAAGPPELR